ncbi:MAG: glycosyltransferase [Ruminococcus sp.]|nr:glycosyltransferase [Ruminococcus sp.]
MKIAFVIPWYGEEIKGGAEMELREVSVHLAAAGVDVEILTTCAKSFDSDWNVNYYAEGTALVCGIPTRRFPVRLRDTGAFNRINRKLMRGENVTLGEEKIFLREMINSPSLCSYIEEHEHLYDLFVFIPYMFGTTFFGVLSCPPNKSVMMPCLHDERYAYMLMFRRTYINIKGMIFNSRPEQELANRLYDLQETKQACIGVGMNTKIQGNAGAFREKFYIDMPFVLYAGRKDTGKNVDTLLKYFAEYKMRNPEDAVMLVLIGGGETVFPEGAEEYILDLGYVDREDKYNAMAAAEFLCQPSKNESFSIVMMESWLCGRPVLVNEKCTVTANFVRQAQGGLYFKDYYEFEGCMRWFAANKEKASQLGKMGNAFVKKNFAWDMITDKYIRFFNELTEE